MYLPKIFVLAVGFAIDALEGTVAYSQGGVDDAGNFTKEMHLVITPFDILFNKLAITDINFFNISGAQGNSVILEIRQNIATWYYVMRNIAASILLVILIYIGIRMAITTVASDKAMYKKMLIDWACSLALIFLLQYIAIFVINLNNALVNVIKGVANVNADDLRNIIGELAKKAVLALNVDSLAAAAVYCMFIIQTFALLISYFSRMLKLAFLIIISPLITLTYAIDKIGDGKAQALGNWLREFIFTVLIQPFHCIIYIVFITMSLQIVKSDDASIAGAILAILCLRFTKEAEKIVRKIFAFKDDGSAGSIATGMAMSAAALGMAQKVGKGTRTAINQVSNVTQNAGREIMATHMAYQIGKEQEQNGQTPDSLTDRRAAALEEINNREEAKKLEKQNKKYKKAAGYQGKASEAKIESEAAKLLAEDKLKGDKGEKLTMSQAKARARVKLARENRKSIAEANGGKMPEIAGFRGRVERFKGKVSSAKAFVERLEVPKMMIATGAGMFTGFASYGSGGNITSAITAGMAAGRGTAEFMKNSTSTFVNDINDRMKSLGINDVAEENAKLDEVMQKGDADEFDDRVLNSILKQIEEALKAKGIDSDESKNIKTSIQNSISKDLTKTPSASVDKVVGSAIENALKGSSVENLNAQDQDGLKDIIGSVATTYAVTRQEAEMYKTMKTATELGIDPNRLADKLNAVVMYNEVSSSSSGTSSTSSGGTGNTGNNPPPNTGNPPGGTGAPVPPPQPQNNSDDTSNSNPVTNEELDRVKQELERMKKDSEEKMREYQAQLQEAEDKLKESNEEREEAKREIQAKIDEINKRIEEVTARINFINQEIDRRESENGGSGNTTFSFSEQQVEDVEDTTEQTTQSQRPTGTQTRRSSQRREQSSSRQTSTGNNRQNANNANRRPKNNQSGNQNPKS